MFSAKTWSRVLPLRFEFPYDAGLVAMFGAALTVINSENTLDTCLEDQIAYWTTRLTISTSDLAGTAWETLLQVRVLRSNQRQRHPKDTTLNG